ncbi:uncharacterized protein [Temnothorax nylanderi]|uniref:uncharacterized protein n=1 Tax=Temnothorax nylanderi TaxID=102681 RepID=UPI003A855A20
MPTKGQGSTIIDEEKEETQAILAARRNLRLPPFWPEEPELWFAQLEGQFALCDIKEDEAKYAYVLSRIEPKQAREVKDVITRPPPPSHNKYEAIKKALIQRLTDSQEQRIRQLLEHEELGDRKPSQFLRHLATLAGSTVSRELLRTLWLGRLPPQTQAILATRSEDKLELIADQADKIHEVNNKALVLATFTQKPKEDDPEETRVDALSKQVAALTLQVSKMVKSIQKDRARNRSRSRGRRYDNRQRSRTPHKEGICRYH